MIDGTFVLFGMAMLAVIAWWIAIVVMAATKLRSPGAERRPSNFTSDTTSHPPIHTQQDPYPPALSHSPSPVVDYGVSHPVTSEHQVNASHHNHHHDAAVGIGTATAVGLGMPAGVETAAAIDASQSFNSAPATFDNAQFTAPSIDTSSFSAPSIDTGSMSSPSVDTSSSSGF